MKRLILSLALASTLVVSVYAVRQRQWALKLKDQLEETNKDDVKIMQLLSTSDKESLCVRLRRLGEDRMADWIVSQYPEPKEDQIAEVD